MNLRKYKFGLLIYLFYTLSGFQWVIAQVPFTDPTNSGAWVLNTDVSDEFDTVILNENKWLIQGKDGVYKSNFIGRAPSQFSTNNAIVEDNKLKILIRWDPTFPFADKIKDGYAFGKLTTTDATFTCPITTAAVIAKTQFQYGYMEINCKTADASVTSSFWALGSGAELDVFENSGKPSLANKTLLESQMWSSIHDWSLTGGPSVWTQRDQLPFRLAAGFHTYGLEWDPAFLKFYADGLLVRYITKEDVETHPNAIAAGSVGWVLDKPLNIWIDSEVFYWVGMPTEASLPVDFEIEYLRVWQKSSSTSAKFPLDLNEDIKVYSAKGSGNDVIIEKAYFDHVLVSLFDFQGRNLFSKEYKNTNSIKISSSDLNLKPGIYLVRLSNNAGVITKKIII